MGLLEIKQMLQAKGYTSDGTKEELLNVLLEHFAEEMRQDVSKVVNEFFESESYINTHALIFHVVTINDTKKLHLSTDKLPEKSNDNISRYRP